MDCVHYFSLIDREDLRIRKPRVEAHGAAMDDSRGSGKAIDI